MIAGDLEANDEVSSSTASSNDAAGTTRFTNPMEEASAASMRRPVSISSNAFFGGIDRSSGTVIMYGHKPMSISGVPNWASSAAITKSQERARPKPPARQ